MWRYSTNINNYFGIFSGNGYFKTFKSMSIILKFLDSPKLGRFRWGNLKRHLLDYFLVKVVIRGQAVDLKFKHKLGLFIMRRGRGNGHLNTFLDMFVIMGMGSLLIGITLDWIPVYALVVLALSYTWLCYTLGYIDEKFGFWKWINDYSAEEMTPFWAKMDKKLDELLEHAKLK